MALAHGSGIVTDGLVLAYDNGSSQSWKGAPTTNLIDAWNPETPATTMYWYYSSGNQYFTKSNVLEDEVNGYYYADVYITTSSQSGYYNGQLYTGGVTINSGSYYSISAWVWTDRAFQLRLGMIKHGSPYTQYIPMQAHELEVGWNYVVTTSSAMSATYTDARFEMAFGYAPAGTHLKIYKPQVEAYQFATPFTPTSRSTTQALTDWVGGQTITMLSLTDYNSDNTFSFDGTNNTDRGIYLPSQNLNGSYSVEAWFKFDATSSSNQGIVGDTQYGWYRFFITANNQVYAGHINNASGNNYNFILGATQLSAGTYHHAVHVFDENAGQRIYVNGVLDASNSNSLNFLLTGRGPQWVGQDRPSAQSTRNVLDGTVPVLRIYKNKALSAAEVAQNYNALRGRFGV